MTTLPTGPTSLGGTVGSVNRALVPQPEGRTVRRRTIDEINQMDPDALREQFYRSRRDDRPGWVKFLDVIDMPRNQIAATIWPGIEREKRLAGERGAFGTGKVYFSDALKSMGVENRAARGIVGFLGDLATDPLTYLGGAGGVARITTASGRVLQIPRSGIKAIREGARAASEGRTIADPTVRGLVQAAGRTGTAKEIEQAVLGGVTTGRVGRAASFLRITPGISREGGTLAKYADAITMAGRDADPAAEAGIKAAGEFVQRYGKGTSPGIRIGRNASGKWTVSGTLDRSATPTATSTVAHIPFTEFGVHVPAFTRDGKAAETALKLAGTPRTGLVTASPRVASIANAVGGIQTQMAELAADIDEFGKYSRETQRQIGELRRSGDPSSAQLEAELAERRVFHAEQMATTKAELKTQMDATWDLTQEREPLDGPASIGDALVLDQLSREARASAEWFANQWTDADDAVRVGKALHSDLAERVAKESGLDPELIRAKYAEGLDDDGRKLLEAYETDPDGMSAFADANQRAAQASINYASATHGAAAEYASKSQRHVQEIVARMLEADDPAVGMSALGGIRSAAINAGVKADGPAIDWLDRVDRFARNVGVGSSGRFQRTSAAARWLATTGQHELVDRLALQYTKDLAKIAEDTGVPRSGLSDLFAIAYAIAHGVREADAGKTLFRNAPYRGQMLGFRKALDEAVAKGYLNESLHPGLRRKLEEYAKTHANMLDDLAALAERERMAQGVIPGYLPKVSNPLAQRLISNTRPGRLGAVQTAAREQFQKARTTTQHQFLSNTTGQEERFFEFQRPAAKLSDAEIAELPPDAREEFSRLRDIINEYDSRADVPPPFETDAFELNELADSGAFDMLLGFNGRKIPGGFMDTNLATVMARRMGAQQAALARRDWARYIAQRGVIADQSAIQKAINVPGGEVQLGNGGTAKALPDGRLLIGGEVYRGIAPDIRGKIDNPIIAALGESRGLVYHESVADLIERHALMFDSDDTAKAILKMYDDVTGMFKNVTLLHPTWTVFNILGDGFNLIAGGARPQDFARHAKNVVQSFMADRFPSAARFDSAAVDVAGTPTPWREFVRSMRSDRVANPNVSAEAFAQYVARGHLRLPSRYLSGLGLKEDWKAAASHHAAYGRMAREQATTGDKIKAVGSVMGERSSRWIFGPNAKINQFVGDVMRSLAYLSFRDQGFDHAESTARVIRSAFDYADMTDIERKTFRRLLPFYAWIKNNAMFQTKLLLEKPIIAGSFPLLHNAVEEAIDGESRIPMSQRPNWMRQQMALQVGSDPDERFMLMLGSALPLEQSLVAGSAAMGAATLDQGQVQDFVRYIGSSLNPIVRLPIEWAAGRELFSGREVGPGDSFSDVTLPGSIAGTIRPLREIPRLVRTFGESGVGAGVARTLLGGRVQAAGQERIETSKLREYREEEERVRRAIRRFEYQGEERESLKARARLLRLYSDMLRAGFESEVPKWAQNQLAELVDR